MRPQILKKPHILSLCLFLLFFGFTGCKSTKTVTAGDSNLKLSAKQLIKENQKQAPEFKTLQSKLKITYSEGDKTQSHTVSYRMEKDKVLWMSATFGIIRAKITPQSVAFYNKLDNTYFEGDFKYFSKLLGTALDFEKVQNIILGEALFNLKDETYNVSVYEGKYVLQPKNQRELFEIFFLVNPSLFKVTSQQLSQMSEQRHLQIDYLAHQEVDKQVLPEHVKVIAVEGTKELIAELEFKSVSLNEDLRFPFKIPSGFKKIEL
ncbi:protein of unknown function [Hyunsoonleella jejuensis]|uniref:Deoxyuridine 5'-triphosphate nucleotidohydrolase n=1 Tax=Hyunsoonleella jejuensis TaxID=419940 RepID=A0A1H9AWA4_9FLAO|nr:protein of unknown function [Hyunsoonleella jejuensis]